MKNITKDKIQFSFDPAVTPVETIEAGEMICFQTQDCYAEQIDHDRKDFTLLDMKRNNPITGPLFVNGAVPGRESQNQSGRESKERMHYGISETLLHLTRI